MNFRGRQLESRLFRRGLGILLTLVGTTSIAHAHGGMAGPDDLGPPLFTSAALAFVCYWIVVLWPASKGRNSGDAPEGRRMSSNEDRRAMRRSDKPASPAKTSQLRKVVTNRASGVSGAGRKASDV